MSAGEAQPLVDAVPARYDDKFDEETAACIAEESAPSGRRAGVVSMGAVGVLACCGALMRHAARPAAGGGVERKLPASMDDFEHNICFYAFLIISLSIIIRQALVALEVGGAKEWPCPRPLFFFCAAVILPIISNKQGGNDIGPMLTWCGAVAAIVAAVMMQLGFTLDVGSKELSELCSMIAGILVVLGVLIPALDRLTNDPMGVLPLLAYCVIGCVYYAFKLLSDKEAGADDFSIICYLTIMLARIAGGTAASTGWHLWCEDVGAILAIAFTVMYGMNAGESFRPYVSYGALGLLWVPLCADNILPKDLDHLLDIAPFYAFSFTVLGSVVCGAATFIGAESKLSGTGKLAVEKLLGDLLTRHLLSVFFYVLIWGEGLTGNYARIADVGCLVGLVAFLIDALSTAGQISENLKLVNLLVLGCCCACGVSVLLG